MTNTITTSLIAVAFLLAGCGKQWKAEVERQTSSQEKQTDDIAHAVALAVANEMDKRFPAPTPSPTMTPFPTDILLQQPFESDAEYQARAEKESRKRFDIYDGKGGKWARITRSDGGDVTVGLPPEFTVIATGDIEPVIAHDPQTGWAVRWKKPVATPTIPPTIMAPTQTEAPPQ